MKEVIREPGFWLMVFGVILIALILFSPNGTSNGKCDTDITVEKSGDKEIVAPKDDDKEQPNIESVKSEGEAAVFMLLVIPRLFRQLRAGGM